MRPFKEKLDVAGGGYSGSPQTALIVNGEVFDYYYGTRTAEKIISMLVSVKNNTKYPFDRCIKRGAARYSCDTKG